MDTIADKTLTTDLIADPNLHRLGLMVSSHGLDVVITSRVRDNALIYRHIDFDPNTSPIKAFEETVYDNPLLTADFGRIDVLIDNRRFFVMAAEDATDDTIAERFEMLYPAESGGPALEFFVNPIEDGRTVLAAAAERDLVRFLRRTFNNPAITHRIAAPARYYALKNRLGNSGKIHVRPMPGRTDIFVFGHNGLMMANSFDTKETSDSVYYTLATARHFAFDNESDCIMIGGDRVLRDQFTAGIKPFASYTMPEIFPSALTLLGEQVMDVPFEILLLPLCE